MYVCIIYKYTNIQCISYCTIIDNRTMRNKYIFILVLFKIEIKRQNGQNTIGIIKYFKVTVISCWSFWYMMRYAMIYADHFRVTNESIWLFNSSI